MAAAMASSCFSPFDSTVKLCSSLPSRSRLPKSQRSIASLTPTAIGGDRRNASGSKRRSSLAASSSGNFDGEVFCSPNASCYIHLSVVPFFSFLHVDGIIAENLEWNVPKLAFSCQETRALVDLVEWYVLAARCFIMESSEFSLCCSPSFLLLA